MSTEDKEQPAPPPQSFAEYLPMLGTYTDIAAFLRLSRKTVYKMVCHKDFKKGIYLGRGRFNMDKLRAYIEQDGRYLNERCARINLW